MDHWGINQWNFGTFTRNFGAQLSMISWGFPHGDNSKEPASQYRRHKRCGFDPWVRKIPGGGHGNPLQYPCLENPMDRGTWWASVHRVTKSWTWLKQFSSKFTAKTAPVLHPFVVPCPLGVTLKLSPSLWIWVALVMCFSHLNTRKIKAWASLVAPPDNAEDKNLLPDPGRWHMLWSN